MVNSSFETNIEHVYAAGPVAEFVQNNSRLTLKHLYYNSVEIGARVADMLMKLLGVQEGDGRIKAKYVQPLSIYCRLPNSCNYLCSSVPGFKFMKCCTKTLKTGNVDDGYFEIIVDSKGEVLKLSCYSKRVSLFNTANIILNVFLFSFSL